MSVRLNSFDLRFRSIGWAQSARPANAGAREVLDLNMLVMNGGRQRTGDEFAALFRQRASG
jgi:hypothetical protein